MQMQRALLYHLFWLVWSATFVLAMGDIIISGTISSWYFAEIRNGTKQLNVSGAVRVRAVGVTPTPCIVPCLHRPHWERPAATRSSIISALRPLRPWCSPSSRSCGMESFACRAVSAGLCVTSPCRMPPCSWIMQWLHKKLHDAGGSSQLVRAIACIFMVRRGAGEIVA